MAINTVSNPIRHVDTGLYMFYGYPVPENVTALIMSDDVNWDSRTIKWRVEGDPDIHEIDFPHVTEANILAVLVAMRLTC